MLQNLMLLEEVGMHVMLRSREASGQAITVYMWNLNHPSCSYNAVMQFVCKRVQFVCKLVLQGSPWARSALYAHSPS